MIRLHTDSVVKCVSPLFFAGELFLSLVLSTKAHANILSVDPSEALEVDGVNSFIDHTNIQGTNRFGFLKDDEEFFATKEVN